MSCLTILLFLEKNVKLRKTQGEQTLSFFASVLGYRFGHLAKYSSGWGLCQTETSTNILQNASSF